MNARVSTLAAALAVLAALTGCQEDKSGPSAPPPPASSISVTPSDAAVVANGTNTVSIDVADSNGGMLLVSTTRGTFDPTGFTTAYVNGSGTVTLRTCDAASVTGCAGNARVTATASGRSASATIVFDTLANVCPDDCGADRGCVGQTCNLTGGGFGVCSSGVTSTCVLSSVAPSGAKASGANFAVTCSPRNLPALAETNCGVSLVDAPFTCVAIVKDRFNNVLADSVPVTFMSETAAVGQIVTTPSYDPAKSGAEQMDLGMAVQGFNTMDSGLPFDVNPDTTALEPSVTHNLDRCGTRTHNPRDGVVTIVAITDGEEAFWDVNGNNSYDTSPVAEPFVDLGEPYVDQNDNGKYDLGEWFLDVNDDGVWTAPNGKWDATTKIWTQTIVLYTGQSVTMGVGGGRVIGTRFAPLPASGGDFVDACTATSVAAAFDVQMDSTMATNPTDYYALVATDLNLNNLNAGTTFEVEKVPDTAPIDLFYFGKKQYTDWFGLFYRYWPCDKAGACASQCRATGANAPCTMKPSIDNFTCGLATSVAITGGTETGSGSVHWIVGVPWTVYDGVTRNADGGAFLSGVVRP